jgi:hypothetical protein
VLRLNWPFLALPHAAIITEMLAESMILFPPRSQLAYIMEGDTPSFLGLVDNGLGWSISPAYGGWGGRCALYQAYGETRPIWTNNQDSRDTVTAANGQTECTDMATLWRWREPFQHDFAARLDWCVADDFKKANHNPVVVLNGDRSKQIAALSAKPGETVKLESGKRKGSTHGYMGYCLDRDVMVEPESAMPRKLRLTT